MFPHKVEPSMIHGTVTTGFEEVEAAFKQNFVERGELGAACAMYYRGEKVVDLWGGYRDHRTCAPWEEDTLALVFSATKGIAAITIAVAHSRGLLAYDEKVAAYWPEFAQRGKADITIRQLLSHQAGLSAIDEPLDLETLADTDKLDAILAKQEPSWEPGTRHGYHCWDLGWYQSALIRRVDPQHRSLGQYFQDEIAAPLNLEFYIGLPDDVPDSRIATIKPAGLFRVLMNLDKVAYLKRVLGPFGTRSVTYRTIMNPRGLTNHNNLNRRDYRSVEMPSVNGIGQVRSMAKVYSVFATGGRELGLKKETLDQLTRLPVSPPMGLRDEVLLVDMSYSLGFQRPLPGMSFGSSDRAFGFGGANGSLAFADPDMEVGFAYLSSKVDFPETPCARALRIAFYRRLESA
jgi:CubicO group peptidase (beta-lactamase class C family)